MRNKILLIIAFLLVAFLVSVRIVFNNKFADFKKAINDYDSLHKEQYVLYKNKYGLELKNRDSIIYNRWIREFNDTVGQKNVDTTFNFLYLNGKLSFVEHNWNYPECLVRKLQIEDNNKKVDGLIKQLELNYESLFPSLFQTWYKKYNLNGNFIYKSDVPVCSSIIDGLIESKVQEANWQSFKLFLTQYRIDERECTNYNAQQENLFSVAKQRGYGQLISNMSEEFNQKLKNNSSSLFSVNQDQKIFFAQGLGNIAYSFERRRFDENIFNSILNEALSEQWKYNSLSTGSMPYGSCFGYSNSCSDYDCSEISVITGGSGDVLVLVKNPSGNVVRHVYIRGGSSYTFKVPNGSYQVFFYSGKGWNPQKIMESNSCSYLKGGFIEDESVTKDNYISLYNQRMSYELILQSNGNFSTQPSNKQEAL